MEEGKKEGKVPLLSYFSRRGKRESFGNFLIFMLLKWIGSHPNAKVVLVKANFTLNVMVYSLFMRLLKWESLCVGKRGKFVVMMENDS